MAVTSPPQRMRPRQRLFWSRIHFFVRLLGLTGALVACVAGVLAGVLHELDAFNNVATVQDAYHVSVNVAQTAVEDPVDHQRTLFLLCGAAAVLFAFVIEVVVVLCFTATRRSAFGFNALLQGAMAAVLLAAVNVWSFEHYERVDFTRDGQFTLPPEIRKELAQLDPNSKTTLIVYQRHKTFGSLTDDGEKDEKPQDEFDSAAENKVVEKIKDLAELLRDTSAQQLNVEVLDTQAKNYKFKDRLAEMTKDAPELRKAIEAAPESSVFFYVTSKGKPSIQRLSFNNFYLLDKTSSQEDHNNRGNLTLLYQGLDPFIQRLTHLEAKRPRIGIAVIHPVLSSSRDHPWAMRGLRQALERRGFEVRDIVLKKWSQFEPPKSAAATIDESALDRLDERQIALENNIRAIERALPALKKQRDEFEKAITDSKKRDELSRRFADRLNGEKLTAEDVQFQVRVLQANLEAVEQALPSYRQRLTEAQEEKSKLNVTALREQQRMTDVQAKMSRLLADCDLLIVPRMTLRNVADSFDNIAARHYKIDDSQVEAIKDYLKAGKPILACFGPSNTPSEERTQRPGDDQPDGLEKLLGDLGIKFGKQTVLFDREVEGFADARADADLGSGQLEPPPPVLFDWQPGVGRPLAQRLPSDKPNRIRQSLQLTARALGKDSQGHPIPLDLRIRHPRPIYYVPPKDRKLDYDPDFLMTDPRSWNEDQPFPTSDGIPQFERPKTASKGPRDREADKDSLEARRRGPFPIGVAIETELPKFPASKTFYSSEADKPATVRVAVIGQGGFFTGKKLPPAEERLFVNTINWLLGRDDQLPIGERVWSYPRVNDTIPPESETEYLWLWGVRLGLPALFGFLGLVVLLFRRLR